MLFLVTGCAGFIGASLCHQILAQGDEVIRIDNLDATLYPAEIKSNRLDFNLTSNLINNKKV
jgi:nucleoside-diphosphate-sugar epimerase